MSHKFLSDKFLSDEFWSDRFLSDGDWLGGLLKLPTELSSSSVVAQADEDPS
jgi:hypothetical protein